MRRAIQRLLAGDRADRTAVDADVALGVPALAPGMLDRLAAPGLREADLIEPRRIAFIPHGAAFAVPGFGRRLLGSASASCVPASAVLLLAPLRSA